MASIYTTVTLRVAYRVGDKMVSGRRELVVPVPVDAVEAVREAGWVTRDMLSATLPVLHAEVERQLLAALAAQNTAQE